MDNAVALNTPGRSAFYWLPPESRVKQIKLLKVFDGLRADVKIYDMRGLPRKSVKMRQAGSVKSDKKIKMED
jgi:hypothetical protein